MTNANELLNYYCTVAAWVSDNDPDCSEWSSSIRGRRMVLLASGHDRIVFVDFTGEEEDGALRFLVSLYDLDYGRSLRFDIDVDDLHAPAEKVGLWCL